MTDYENSILERVVKLEHKMEQLEENLEELKPFKEQVIRQDEHYNQIMLSLTELKDDVKQIKSRGARFWDYSITAIIAAIIGFVVSKFFGNP